MWFTTDKIFFRTINTACCYNFPKISYMLQIQIIQYNVYNSSSTEIFITFIKKLQRVPVYSFQKEIGHIWWGLNMWDAMQWNELWRILQLLLEGYTTHLGCTVSHSLHSFYPWLKSWRPIHITSHSLSSINAWLLHFFLKPYTAHT